MDLVILALRILIAIPDTVQIHFALVLVSVIPVRPFLLLDRKSLFAKRIFIAQY